MAGEPSKTDGLDRVLDILGTPLLLRILYALGNDVEVTEVVPPDSDPMAIETAVERLVEIGAVWRAPVSNAGRLVLTTKGWRLANALMARLDPDQGQ